MKEFNHADYISISTPHGSEDFKLFQSVVNVGIDSHLEAFIKSKFFPDCGRFYFHFHKSEKHILLRRLEAIAHSTEDSDSIQIWIEDIENYDGITKEI